jgi:IstB-like ATP binding protein
VAAAITIEEVAMLNHPTVERLRDLGLVGMIHAFEEQRRQPDSAQLSFEDRLAMLVDREVLERDNKRLNTRLRFAGLRQMASPPRISTTAHIAGSIGPCSSGCRKENGSNASRIC